MHAYSTHTACLNKNRLTPIHTHTHSLTRRYSKHNASLLRFLPCFWHRAFTFIVNKRSDACVCVCVCVVCHTFPYMCGVLVERLSEGYPLKRLTKGIIHKEKYDETCQTVWKHCLNHWLRKEDNEQPLCPAAFCFMFVSMVYIIFLSGVSAWGTGIVSDRERIFTFEYIHLMLYIVCCLIKCEKGKWQCKWESVCVFLCRVI